MVPHPTSPGFAPSAERATTAPLDAPAICSATSSPTSKQQPPMHGPTAAMI